MIYNLYNVIDKKKVGNKAYNLMLLKRANYNVPNGFVLSRDFCKKINKKIILKEEKDQIKEYLRQIDYGGSLYPLVVRSSSIYEDLKNKSFAGQYTSVTNVKNEKELFVAILKVIASQDKQNLKSYSSKILSETLIFLKNNYPLDLLSVQMTITNLNVNHMSEDVEKIMLEYGVDTIKLEPVHSSFSERSKNVSFPKIEDYIFNFLKTIDSLVQKNINGYLDISCLTIPSTSYFCSIRNKTIISPYKIMAPCVEIIKPGTKDDLILNYDLNNIDFNNIRKIQEKKLFNLHPKNYNVCSNCNFVHFCKSNCPMRTILSNSKPNIYNCMLSKKLLPEFLERANKNEKYMAIVFGNDYKKEEVCD